MDDSEIYSDEMWSAPYSNFSSVRMRAPGLHHEEVVGEVRLPKSALARARVLAYEPIGLEEVSGTRPWVGVLWVYGRHTPQRVSSCWTNSQKSERRDGGTLLARVCQNWARNTQRVFERKSQERDVKKDEEDATMKVEEKDTRISALEPLVPVDSRPIL